MTVKDLIIETGYIPKHFVTSEGWEFKLFTNDKGDGYSAMYWQMKGEEKVHLFAFEMGTTESEALETLKQYILNL